MSEERIPGRLEAVRADGKRPGGDKRFFFFGSSAGKPSPEAPKKGGSGSGKKRARKP